MGDGYRAHANLHEHIPKWTEDVVKEWIRPNNQNADEAETRRATLWRKAWKTFDETEGEIELIKIANDKHITREHLDISGVWRLPKALEQLKKKEAEKSWIQKNLGGIPMRKSTIGLIAMGISAGVASAWYFWDRIRLY